MFGVLIALLAALLWAWASVILAGVARRLPVLPLNTVRCAAATLFFWAMLPFYGGLAAVPAIPAENWLWLLLSVMALLVVGDTLFFRAMHLAGVSWAMPVAGTNPLWTVLFAVAFLGEQMAPPEWLGAVLVVVGIILLSLQHNPEPTTRQARRSGILLALAASICWAAGTAALRPATAGVDSIVANAVRQPIGTLLLLGLMLPRKRGSATPSSWQALRQLDRRNWAALVAGSLLGTGAGSWLFVVSIQQLGAGRAAVLTSVTPLFGLPIAVLLLGERPTWRTMVGVVCAVAGITLVA